MGNFDGTREPSYLRAVLRSFTTPNVRAQWRTGGGKDARTDLSHRIDRRDHGDTVLLRPALMARPSLPRRKRP